MTPGKIRIKDKVYFEPDGLPKPDLNNYDILDVENDGHERFKRDVIKYEASKQLVEVSNRRFITWQKNCPVHWAFTSNNMDLDRKKVEDNQPCKAEITGKTATIVELIKI